MKAKGGGGDVNADADADEIIKAVAQAWHGHWNNPKSAATSEFDAHKRNFKSKPTRFKLEAMAAANCNSSRKLDGSSRKLDGYWWNITTTSNPSSATWDFGQSLWDSYEIVAVSKKLESRGLLVDNMLDAADGIMNTKGGKKKRRESKNSLRNLFNNMSSRRFNEDYVP